MIPSNKSFLSGKELYNISKAAIEYGHLAGDGIFTRKCQTWLQRTLSCKKALLTHSCTAALEMAAILCDIQLGDEIIMPSYTFVSTANAFVLRGGVPVFVDIKSDNLNIDDTKIEKAITEKTKAIVPVHYAGVPCAMDEINRIASKYNLFVIEDAAQALLSKYKGKNLGTIGDIGTISFHETKNVISGEGGALLINNDRFLKRAELIWEKGTNRKEFFQGQVDKYTWVDIGSSYLPSELISAFLYAQLELAEKITTARRKICELYYDFLKPLDDQGKLKLPWSGIPPRNCDSDINGHIFYIITASLNERIGLIKYLKAHEIHAVSHYIPLHSAPAGIKYGRTSGDMSNTDDLSDRVLRLPIFYGMKRKQVEKVVATINEFYGETVSNDNKYAI